MSNCSKCIHKGDRCFCPPDKECIAFKKEKTYIERTFKFKTSDDWVPGESGCWYECPFSLMIPFGQSCKFIKEKMDCPFKIFMNDMDNKDGWILVKDRLPELKLETHIDKQIMVSEPVKLKTKNGNIYTAKYVFCLIDSKRYFPRLYWQICENGCDKEMPVDDDGNDRWMELSEEHEGE